MRNLQPPPGLLHTSQPSLLFSTENLDCSLEVRDHYVEALQAVSEMLPIPLNFSQYIVSNSMIGYPLDP